MIFIYSFFFWIYLALVTAVLVILGIPSVFFSKQPYKLMSRIWAKMLLLYLGIRVKTEGLEKLDKNTYYVFMGNHLSYADIFVLLHVFSDRLFLFMAKKELFKIPFFGFALKKIGMIPIEREDRKDGLKSLLSAAKKISEGYSVLLFPEGTRSSDGKLGSFKRGAFVLAGRTGNKIAPFIISGTSSAVPKHSFRVYPFKKVHLKFLEPMDSGGMKDRELLEHVRGVMLNELGQKDNFSSGE
ncbi:1-acyl-sn-glycerol-3-phosphate acyltransferase [Geovibrio thiophilus]|uniref:1-acyl-sn-glycerol-3-phosphate acyltransferase n=1 Tax=Geovibrio thiophilus TaxID=139438 RepID=A0A410JYN3_9BACT|nr:lysophospholipid acyltransferase family protein [Geovibrio thiophilus]QAR33262.1 1-acyl-sn-glycerol-3-phosphate acyltransferase [Geovibrio thiophilus]